MKAANWELLRKLRSIYLFEKSTTPWSPEILEMYDTTFGRRIYWKWQWVLKQISALGWTAPENNWVDFGCGTAVATEAILNYWPQLNPTQLQLMDRSEIAITYSQEKCLRLRNNLKISAEKKIPPDAFVLLSHVLGELKEKDLEELINKLKSVQTILWVEPGTYELSRKLIKLRESLKLEFTPLAPCPHPKPCGLMKSTNEKHWCHFFADVPTIFFTENFWSQFSKELSIDLRSLPVSYLLLDKRPLNLPLPREIVLGRPRIYKGYGQFLTCSESGVEDKKILMRNSPERFRRS